jgi:hypothetical protein
MRLIAFVIGVSMATSAACADGLYWTEASTPNPNAGRIRSADLNGAGASILLELPFFSVSVSGVGVDERIGRMWWMHGSFTGSIVRSAKLDGSDEQVFTEPGQGSGLSTDSVHQRVYWVDALGGCCTNEAYGCGYGRDPDPCVAIHDDDYGPIIIAPEVDPLNRKIYAGLYDELTRMNLDGSEAEILALVDAAGIALDPVRNQMFLLQSADGAIERRTLDGREPIVIVPGDGVTTRIDVEIDPVAGRLYWIAADGSAILASDLDGGNVQTVATNSRGYLITAIDVVRLAISGPDLNGDALVDGADLGLLLSAWGDCDAETCLGDLDGNGEIDGADLGLLLSAWTG